MFKLIYCANRSDTPEWLVKFSYAGSKRVGFSSSKSVRGIAYLGLPLDGDGATEVYTDGSLARGNFKSGTKQYWIDYFNHKYSGIDLSKTFSVNENKDGSSKCSYVQRIFDNELGWEFPITKQDDYSNRRFSITLIKMPMFNSHDVFSLYYQKQGHPGELTLSQVKRDLKNLGVNIITTRTDSYYLQYSKRAFEYVEFVISNEYADTVIQYVNSAKSQCDIGFQEPDRRHSASDKLTL